MYVCNTMKDTEILERIGSLVDLEHSLRSRREAGDGDADDHRKLEELEATLDQCWDLLRQRRARREFGEDPESAAARPPGVVRGYQQ